MDQVVIHKVLEVQQIYSDAEKQVPAEPAKFICRRLFKNSSDRYEILGAPGRGWRYTWSVDRVCKTIS